MNKQRAALYSHTDLYPHPDMLRHDYDALEHYSIEDRPHPDDEAALYTAPAAHYPDRAVHYHDRPVQHRYQERDQNHAPLYKRNDGPSSDNFHGAPSFGDPSFRGPSFRGIGPKGYGRSDENIREDVCEYLTEDADVDATHIEISVATGVVELRGSVRDRRQKYRAALIADAVRGVKDVLNRLNVLN